MSTVPVDIVIPEEGAFPNHGISTPLGPTAFVDVEALRAEGYGVAFYLSNEGFDAHPSVLPSRSNTKLVQVPAEMAIVPLLIRNGNVVGITAALVLERGEMRTLTKPTSCTPVVIASFEAPLAEIGKLPRTAIVSAAPAIYLKLSASEKILRPVVPVSPGTSFLNGLVFFVDVPPGQHLLVLKSEKLGTIEREVNVGTGDCQVVETRVDMKLAN